MSQRLKSYINIFWQMLKTDLYIYTESIVNNIINSTIWFVCLIVVFAYIFPQVGMREDYGAFMAMGAIVSTIFWSIWESSVTFVADLEGNKTITYFLTLPAPNTLIFIKQIVSYAIRAAVPGTIILPLAKLMLWDKLPLHAFSPTRFTLMFIVTTIFIGTFSLLIASFVGNMRQIGNISMRFLFPLWFFGGSNYSWATVKTISPTFAYFSLIDPLLYPMEGIRAATLGQEGNIAFWPCVVIIICFTAVFGWWSIRRIKRRLDYV